MKKTIISLSLFLLFPILYPSQSLAKSKTLPPGLEDKGPLTKITFIHYKKSPAKPSKLGKPAKSSPCYGFLANNAKWKIAEPYLINPLNQDGLSAPFILDSLAAGVGEWERYGGNIFGVGTSDYSAIYGQYDQKNSVQFGLYPDPNVIAVTSVWGYFSGPPQTRQLVEWDMLFNDSFTWGDAHTNSSLMDLQNIATHELGHSAGMADLYETACQSETMYGYSTEGEISKRDLGLGDITGIQKLY
ncbi:matrixin family metalloprotease [Patescibacteria group bacterium]|nr:matrixin family metalloprotease [Patescibacteria group bacterium]